uniref:Venom polypeptide n=1 Tax=Dolopus genitalis TaxID=2488630 RepID=A0A3G5BIH6_DOLGE|nr:venom polypeptide [Dolopus genitalis]
MKWFAVFLLVSAISNAKCSKLPEGRIIGGENGDISDFPYQLSLRIAGRHNCGASVISKRWVLTAAHCLEKILAIDITLRAGSTFSNTGGKIIPADKLFMHPDYNSRWSDYDVGLIRTKTDLTGDNIEIVRLPNFNDPINTGDIATVSGWGYTSNNTQIVSEHLKFVNIPIVDQGVCNSALKNYGGVRGMMFCAGEPGKDACQGDSGGPIVSKGVQIGVVSGGIECGNPKYYGVYTRLANANVRAWIRNVAKI